MTQGIQFFSFVMDAGAPDIAMGVVDVVDVAKAHILAMENTQAEVRDQ
jgi:hypothetical protein